MSEWTTFRDKIVETLKFDEVTEQMKQDLTEWLLKDLLPTAKESANEFVSQIKEQSKSELGWCKVRDAIVLPFIINGGLWLIETSLTKTSQGIESSH